jgi:hypothetical protein
MSVILNPETLNPKPPSLNLQPSTLNPNPYTLSAPPCTKVPPLLNHVLPASAGAPAACRAYLQAPLPQTPTLINPAPYLRISNPEPYTSTLQILESKP